MLRATTLNRLTAEGLHYYNLYIGFDRKVRVLRHHGCRIVMKKISWSREEVVAATRRAERYRCRKGSVIRTFVVDRPAKQFSYGKVFDGDYDARKPRQKFPQRRFEILNGPSHFWPLTTRLSAERRHYRFFRFRDRHMKLMRHPQLGRIFEATKQWGRRPFRLYVSGKQLSRFPHQMRLIKIPVGDRFVMVDLYYRQLEPDKQEVVSFTVPSMYTEKLPN